MEGNDTFYVLGTRSGVTYSIIGGLGSDSVIVAGDVTQRIVSNQVTGNSGVINHGSHSEVDTEYDGAIIPGIAVTIAGAANASGAATGAIVIAETDGSTSVTENALNGLGAFDEYTIAMALDRTQYVGALVYLTISAAAASTGNRDSQNRQGASVEISSMAAIPICRLLCWSSMPPAMQLGAYRKRFEFAR